MLGAMAVEMQCMGAMVFGMGAIVVGMTKLGAMVLE